MHDIPTGVMVGALVLLILLSAFFSAAEISVMSLNRYRLRHLADTGHRGARLVSLLLRRPDRLLGVILLGNNFVNNFAAALATVLALRFYGESAVAAAAFALTVVILIFAEVGPKTFAAMRPEQVAFPASFILRPLLAVFYPMVWLINVMANLMLRPFGINPRARTHQLSSEELRAAVLEAGTLIPESHQAMLLGILDLEKTAVDDVMIPRNTIYGVDLEQDWDTIVSQIMASRYTRVPLYRGSLDNIIGLIHMRRALNLVGTRNLTPETLQQIVAEPFYIPTGTSLTTALISFREAKRRRGLVVDEYGDILGLVTLEEILEEIVGEFTTPGYGASEDFKQQADGSWLVKGGANLRDLNRQLGWDLPTGDMRTVNGLITEYLETIPEAGTSLMIEGYAIDVVRTRGTAVDTARISPPQATEPETPEAD
ncbi:MAG: HlyC/CorC family transporter [Acidiferrobacteraceae bacterium]